MISAEGIAKKPAWRQQNNNSATGTRTRVARVRAEYPNQLDYSGMWQNAQFAIGFRRFGGRSAQKPLKQKLVGILSANRGGVMLHSPSCRTTHTTRTHPTPHRPYPRTPHTPYTLLPSPLCQWFMPRGRTPFGDTGRGRTLYCLLSALAPYKLRLFET